MIFNGFELFEMCRGKSKSTNENNNNNNNNNKTSCCEKMTNMFEIKEIRFNKFRRNLLNATKEKAAFIQ